MAQRSDYEKMSREQLLAMLGSDADPDTPQEDLVSMAMERDNDM